MRSFKELRESVYSPNGANVPDATDGLDAVGIYRIEKPEVLARINAVVQACFSMPTSDVRQKMIELRHKLNIAGYDLDLSQFRPVEGQYKIPLNRFGGRYGFDMEKGKVTADDGIEPFAGYKMSLNVTITLDNFSFYRVEGSIQPDGTSDTEGLEEGFASDAQRRAAFASGYKEKGKKGKKEGLRQDLSDLKKKNEEVSDWYESLRTFMVRTESVDESVRGVRKNDGPFTVVAMKGNKVMNQFRNAEFTELKDVITMMKAENKGAKISVESKGGKVVHTESRDRFDYLDRQAASQDRDFAAKKFMDALKKAKIKAKYHRSLGKVEVEKGDLRKAQGIGKRLKVDKEGVRIDGTLNRSFKGVFDKNEDVKLDEDKQSARELQLFVDNDRQIYTRRMMPIFKNLMSKRAAGKYDPKLATKLFMYAMDDGAKAYVKMHDAPGAKWNKVFDKQTRMMAADNARREFEGEADLGSYDEMIPKKYRK